MNTILSLNFPKNVPHIEYVVHIILSECNKKQVNVPLEMNA